MKLDKNKIATIIVTVVGIVFLIFPLMMESYSHYLQDLSYKNSHEQTVSCRAKLALEVIDHPHSLKIGQRLEKYPDSSCGELPRYDDFTYISQSGILAIYNWIAQKVSVIPL